MTVAVAQDYDDWLAENATYYCMRFSASITSTACDSTRALSGGEGGDLRCEGCEGLHYQTERGVAQLQLVASSAATDKTAGLEPFTGAPLSAVLQKMLPRNLLGDVPPYLVAGQELEMEKLVEELLSQGYDDVPLVKERGTFSVRGGIVDIFPPDLSAPLRIDFYGDCIDTIQTFDPITQQPDVPFRSIPYGVEDETDVDPETVDEEPGYSDAWIDEDALDEEMLRLFPELSEFIEDHESGRKEQIGKKYIVFLGRCQRCSGYMLPDRHHLQDDETYKCSGCGWRISPVYHWNRLNPVPSRFFR